MASLTALGTRLRQQFYAGWHRVADGQMQRQAVNEAKRLAKVCLRETVQQNCQARQETRLVFALEKNEE